MTGKQLTDKPHHSTANPLGEAGSQSAFSVFAGGGIPNFRSMLIMVVPVMLDCCTRSGPHTGVAQLPCGSDGDAFAPGRLSGLSGLYLMVGKAIFSGFLPSKSGMTIDSDD